MDRGETKSAQIYSYIFRAACKKTTKQSIVGQHCRWTSSKSRCKGREQKWNTDTRIKYSCVGIKYNEICTKWILISSIWLWSAHILVAMAASAAAALKVMVENMYVRFLRWKMRIFSNLGMKCVDATVLPLVFRLNFISTIVFEVQFYSQNGNAKMNYWVRKLWTKANSSRHQVSQTVVISHTNSIYSNKYRQKIVLKRVAPTIGSINRQIKCAFF